MALLRASADPIAGDTSPFIVFYISVGWAAVVGGVGAGLLALSLGTALGTFLWIPPRYSFFIEKPEDVALLKMFAITAGWMCLLGGLARLARLEAERRSAEVESIAQFPLENPNPIFRFSEDGTLLFMNRPADAIAPFCLSQVKELALSVHEHREMCEMTCALSSKRIFIFSCFWIPKRGYVNVYGKDVTLQVEAEEALRRSEEEATQANQAKDAFLAVLSHELRTPLTPVLLAVGRLEMEVQPHLIPLVQLIRRNVSLEAHLIDDLLDVTKIARGKLSISLKPISLHSVVEDAIEVCRGEIDEKKLSLKVSLMAGTPVVEGDPSRLQQVFWNLLRNAVKFTEPGGSIEMRSFILEGMVRVEVQDSGIGIPSERLGAIFEAFEQGDSFITRRFGGLGLGLSISKRLIELHGGVISVKSEGVNRGAVFTVELPLSDKKLEALPRHKGEMKRSGAPLEILLVEDHRDTALLMETILSSWGHSIRTAYTAADAELSALTYPFDLLITDLGLPDKSGVELFRALKERNSDLRAIALTGYGREEDYEKTREAGFLGHLTKPIDVEDLRRFLVN